jgi:hypothetical protein
MNKSELAQALATKADISKADAQRPSMRFSAPRTGSSPTRCARAIAYRSPASARSRPASARRARAATRARAARSASGQRRPRRSAPARRSRTQSSRPDPRHRAHCTRTSHGPMGRGSFRIEIQFTAEYAEFAENGSFLVGSRAGRTVRRSAGTRRVRLRGASTHNSQVPAVPATRHCDGLRVLRVLRVLHVLNRNQRPEFGRALVSCSRVGAAREKSVRMGLTPARTRARTRV